MKYTKLFLVIAAIICTTSCNQKGKQKEDTGAITIIGNATYSDTATSSVKVFDQNGKVCIQQNNTYYEIVNAYEGQTKIPLLLKIKKTSLCVADSVNSEKVFEVEAKSVMDTKSVAWQNKFVATQIEFRDNVIVAVKEGAENEEDLLTRFSLLDGKEVFSCSYADMKVVVPNVKEKRFIGFTSQTATTHPVQNLKQENVLGIINYSSGSAPIASLLVKLKRSATVTKIPAYTPEMVLVADNPGVTAIEDGKSIVMMKADEHYTSKDITDFSAKFTFYYGDDNEATEIIIPVRNDKLDLASARFDKDIFEIILR